MALNRKIEEFQISSASFGYDLPVQNMTIEWIPESYSEPVEAIDGTLYHRLAAHRARIEINYDSNIAPATWRALFNSMHVALVDNGLNSVEFYADETKTTADDRIDVIPENYSYLTQYSNQFGNFAPNLVLIGVNRIDFIDSDFDGPS